MSDQSFDDILSMDTGEIHRPPAKPVGYYRCTITKYEYVESSKKGTKGVAFTFTGWEPAKEVDADQWNEYLQHPAIKGEYQKDERQDTFWLTQKALYRLREFAEKCQVTVEGKPLRQVIDECKGQTVLVNLQQTPGQDGTVYNDVRGYAEI